MKGSFIGKAVPPARMGLDGLPVWEWGAECVSGDRFTRIIPGPKDLSYEDRLGILALW